MQYTPNIYKARYVRVAKIERPYAWIFVAYVVEQEGNEVAVVSEPKVLKIVPKSSKHLTLEGDVQESAHILPQGVSKQKEALKHSIPSPYVASFASQSDFVVWFSARPPTIA